MSDKYDLGKLRDIDHDGVEAIFSKYDGIYGRILRANEASMKVVYKELAKLREQELKALWKKNAR